MAPLKRRPSSLPRAEIVRSARTAIASNGGPTHARVFYKYDCAGCDRRVQVVEAGVLPTRARCDTCGAWTTITAAGYALHFKPPGGNWDADPLVVRKAYVTMPDAATSSEFER
jgi:predicted nucleic acid-binding Zn ribbon protein